MRQFELYAIITQPIALMSFTAYLARQVVPVNLISGQASQRLNMARYATSTTTEIQTQRDPNPVLTSASQQAAAMGISSH